MAASFAKAVMSEPEKPVVDVSEGILGMREEGGGRFGFALTVSVLHELRQFRVVHIVFLRREEGA